MTSRLRISLNDLIVNPSNDRHGNLKSEALAIEWLLVNKTEKMKDLLEDIVRHKGKILEEPLVMKDLKSNQYIVFDGNRRVTCLKLLYGLVPHDIKNPLKKKLENIKDENDFSIVPTIECRIETDSETVNDLLELRHTPGNSGAGQLKWDGHEKENFLERTGRSKKINFAREINKVLIEEGYLNSEDRLPLSTFNRLFSSNDMRRRAGVDIQGDNIQLINDKDSSFEALARVAKDMIAGKRTLDDVWDNDKKTKYLDELEKSGVLPSAKNRLSEPEVVVGKNSGEGKLVKRSVKAPSRRQYLLATNLPTPEHNQFFSNKFCELFHELQNTLKFDLHAISISISFRAFLEILSNAYLTCHGLDDSGSLAVKIKRAFDHMQSVSTMPEETRSFIIKLSDANEYFSINTLHKVTHHNLQISESDLKSYVNNLDAYIRVAINSVNSRLNLAAA